MSKPSKPTPEPGHSPEGAYEKNILNAAQGTGIVAVGKLFAYAGRFVVAFLLARLLGAEEYGMYNLALSAAAITATVSILGLDDAVMRYIAVYAARRDEAGIWGALLFCIGGVAVLSGLLSLGLFVLAGPIAMYVFHSPDLARLLRLISLLVPFLALSEMLAYATRGFKKMSYSVIAENFVQLTIRVVLIAILGFLGLNAFLAVLVFGLSDVAASAALLFFLNKEFPLRRSLRAARIDWREITVFSMPLWATDLLSTFRNNLQTLLLGSLSTLTGVGIFTVVERVNLLGHVTYQSILTSSKPIIAEMQAQDDFRSLGRLYRTTSRWGFTANLPVFLVLALFPSEILSIFGRSFMDGAAALRILALAELVNVSTGVCGSIIDMTGHTRLKLVNSLIQIAISLGFNLWLIPLYGVLGAAVAALLGIAAINLLRLVEVWFLFRLLPYDEQFLKPLVSGGAALLAALALGRWFSTDAGLLAAGVQALAVLVVYAGLLYLLGLPEDDRTVLARTGRRATAMVSQGRAAIKRFLPV